MMSALYVYISWLFKATVDVSTERTSDEPSQSKADCLCKTHKEAFNLSMLAD